MRHAAPRFALLALTALAAATACSPGQAGGVPAEADRAASAHGGAAPAIAAPKLDAPLAPKTGLSTAVFAGGCFWGVEAVFEHLKGVARAESGYAGGSAGQADYDTVSTGRTRHAESVKVTYDPSKISYGRLLQVFFSVAHDPTQVDRQGPDRGPQYRSALFFRDAEQQKIATAYIAQLQAAKAYPRAIATQLQPLKAFYPAERHHQDYMRRNPRDPYIVYHDAPKLVALKRQFPALYNGG